MTDVTRDLIKSKIDFKSRQKIELSTMTENKCYESLTRTIKVICLSRFLPLFLLPRQICNAYTATAPVLLTSFVTGDKFVAIYQHCTATLVMLIKICIWTAKTRAIPSLHRDSFIAKVPGLCPLLASGKIGRAHV